MNIDASSRLSALTRDRARADMNAAAELVTDGRAYDSYRAPASAKLEPSSETDRSWPSGWWILPVVVLGLMVNFWLFFKIAL